MENQVEETGMERFRRLQNEAKELGIATHKKSADILEKAISDKKAGVVDVPKDALTAPAETDGISPEEALSIEARLKFEDETREKFKRERQITTDRAEIVAESESLCILIDLPENPTELELAKARRTLGLKKTEIKPSPETVAIEASKRGYYVFTNREQDDASHTVNLGGKYFIHLVPDQVHVLSEYHTRRWRQIAVVPNYQRVPTGVTAGPNTVGQAVEECKRVGDKPRFAFEYLGEAPQDARFGLVTDVKILDELKTLT
jgi:hypothetical protein